MMLRKTLLIALVASQITACGSIFYPDRRGQIDGKIDPLIAGLDAVGLLFYIVPGAVALGVDFTTGAIYFPKNRYTVLPDKLQDLRGAAGQINRYQLQVLIEQETGQHISLTDPQIQISTANTQQLLSLNKAYPIAL